MALCRATFNVNAKTQRGETVVLLGDCMALGSFNPAQAIPLVTTPDKYPVWSTARPVTVPRGHPIKYRYAVVTEGRISYWERVGDRRLATKLNKVVTNDMFGEKSRAAGGAPPRTLSVRPSAPGSSPMSADTSISGSALGVFGRVLLPSSPIRTPGHVEEAASPSSSPTAGPVPAATAVPHMSLRKAVEPVSWHSPLSLRDAMASPPTVDVTQALLEAVSPSFSPGDAAAAVGGGGGGTAAASEEPPSAQFGAGPSRQVLTELLDGHKVLIVTYHLPIVLRRNPVTNAWSASWDQDNIIGRSQEFSLADDLSVVWVGCVTAQCLDRPSSGDALPRRLSSSSLSSPASADEPADSYLFTDADMEEIRAVLAPMGAVPLFATSASHIAFGNYCTNVLSPALHNVLETDTVSDNEFSLSKLVSGFEAFRAMNAFIAGECSRVYAAGDALWVYGYELALFPQTFASLQDHVPSQVFFLSAPFPTSEVFRALSIRDDFLDGILAANVVGFHTFNHARHFMQSCKRVAGLTFQSRKGGRLSVEYKGRDVLIAITHVGVQVPLLKQWMSSKQTAVHVQDLVKKHSGRMLAVTFGKCDRLSGVSLLLLAVERLMAETAVYRGKITFVVRVEVPGHGPRSMASRRWSEENRTLTQRINDAYPGTVDYDEAMSFPPTYRVALYYVSDILLHTPTMEGLNLVPFEYVYTRVEWMRMGAVERATRAGTPIPASPPQHSSEVIEKEIAFLSLDKKSKARAVGPPRHPTGRAGLPIDTLEEAESEHEDRDGGEDVGSTSSSPQELTLSASMVDLLAPPTFPSDLSAPLPPRTRAGVVVLSEFSTASHAMNSHLVVNPWSVKDVAQTIDQAVRLEDMPRLQRLWRDCQYIVRNPVWMWTRQVLHDLLTHGGTSGGELTEVEPSVMEHPSHTRTVVVGSTANDGELSPLDLPKTASLFAGASRRVIVLDFYGTVLPVEGSGRYVKQQYFDGGHSMRMPPTVYLALKRLSADPLTTVCIVTDLTPESVDSSPVASLDGVILAAQDGALLSFGCDASGNRVWSANSHAPQDTSTEWVAIKSHARDIMEQYCARVGGSIIIEDCGGVRWNYHNADPEWGGIQAPFLFTALSAKFDSPTVKVTSSNGRISVCLAHNNRGEVIREVLDGTPGVDFVLCFGAESSDEDMFVMLHAMMGDPVDLMSPSMSGHYPTPVAAAMTSSHTPPFALDGEAEETSIPAAVRTVLPIESGGTMHTEFTAHAVAQRVAAISSLRTVRTVCVGRKRTNARSFVPSSEDVYKVLQTLADSTLPL